MRLLKTLILSMFLVTGLVMPSFSGERMSVTFLNPGAEEDAFFGMMTSFMQAAADDLKIDLEVIYCDRDHLKLHEEGVRLLRRDVLPEYLILINEKNGVVDTLIDASNRGVKVALINEGLQAGDKKRIGEPGEQLLNWVLEYLPDDEQAGRMLAQALIGEARMRGVVDETKRIRMAGVSGTYQTDSSSKRIKGLMSAVQANGQVKLMQIAPAYWEEERAEIVTEGLLDRYADLSVVWAASDLMARGALRGAAGLNREIITGGIDWAEFALHEVKEGRFSATVGGHFMDGAWALIMLYDLHHGLALPEQQSLSQFSLIHKGNVDSFLDHFGKQDWSEIDFSRFSRSHNSTLQEYDFGLTAVMEQVENP